MQCITGFFVVTVVAGDIVENRQRYCFLREVLPCSAAAKKPVFIGSNQCRQRQHYKKKSILLFIFILCRAPSCFYSARREGKNIRQESFRKCSAAAAVEIMSHYGR